MDTGKFKSEVMYSWSEYKYNKPILIHDTVKKVSQNFIYLGGVWFRN